MKCSKKNKFLVMFVFTIFLIVTLLLFIMPFNRKPKQIDAKKLCIPFTQAIDTINKRVVDLTTLSDLLGVEEFLSIFATSDKYLPEANAYIRESVFNEQQKIIVVYSMQNLSYNKYIQFFYNCADLYLRKKINSNVILNVIAPSSEWNHKISNSFLKFKVRRVLKDIRKMDKNPPELNEVIDMILSGKLWLFGLLQ